MKTVDTVDKSGLPVAAADNELTEKDLRCIAMHSKFFAFKELMGKDCSLPCGMCDEAFKDENLCPGADYHFHQVLWKLERITGATLWGC